MHTICQIDVKPSRLPLFYNDNDNGDNNDNYDDSDG